jgi:M6 family metalloprotease-like protein/MYXO-CTERM domain-containing protein
MRFRSNLLRALVASTLFLEASYASALIVHEGRVVSAWPDGPTGPLALGPGAGSSFYSAPKGVIYGLTIVVDFSDTPSAFTIDEIESWLLDPGYSEGGLKGSIRDYYLDQSNGQIDLRNDVIGFVRASQPKSYYEAGENYTRATELVAEVLAAIDPMVDFSKYDNDGDGSTEAISIAYAGPMVEFAQGLWPHAGSTRETRDGTRLPRYQMTSMGTELGLYVFAHELGHMLFGWPDLYGFGNYCIMGNSSDTRNPVGINDVYRADQGWIPIIDITESTNARFNAVPNTAGYRYVNPRDSGEWFFWYNQQNTGRWSTLRGNGLLVLHFDHSLRTNTPPNPLSLAVVQADGRKQLDGTQWPMPGSDAADFYPAGGNTELSASTNPASDWNDGSDSGLRLYEISESDQVMTFAVGTGTPGPGIGGAAPIGGAGGMVGGAAGMMSGFGGMGIAGMPSGATGGASTGGLAGESSGGSNTGGAAAGTTGAAGTLGTGGTTGGPTGGASSGGSAAVAGAGGGAAAAPGGGAGPGAPPSPDDDGGGCGCRVGGKAGPARHLASAALALALGLVLRRWRRRGRIAN